MRACKYVSDISQLHIWLDKAKQEYMMEDNGSNNIWNAEKYNSYAGTIQFIPTLRNQGAQRHDLRP